MSTKDTILYDRLGVAINASTDEINKAGRKMSMKWHPDKHQSDTDKAYAEEKFKEIREAIDILSDTQKRSRYDQVGIDGIKGGSADPPSGFPGFPFGMGGMGGMSGMGGMGMPFGFGGKPPGTPDPIVHHLTTTLEKIAREQLIPFSYSRNVKCADCNGDGTVDTSKVIDCRACNGSGTCFRLQQMGPITQHVVMPCEKCGQKGKTVPDEYRCRNCVGNGYVIKKETSQIKLQKTLDNDMKLRLEGQGHNVKQGKSDLIVVIHVEPHEAFERYGCNLVTEIELSLYEALFGFTKTVYHLDGRVVKIQYRGKTDYGTYRKMIGDGLVDARTGKQGNLYLYFTFILPEIDRIDQIVDESVIENDDISSSFEYTALLDIDDVDQRVLSPSTNASSPRFTSKNRDEKNERGNNGNEHQQECRQM